MTGDDYAREPPRDIEAEKAVLGALMMAHSPEGFTRVAAIITPRDHYRPEHQVVHEAIEKLAGRGDPFGAVAVADELRKRGLLERYGGAPWLYTLISRASFDAEYDAAIVAGKAARRRRIEQGQRLIQMACNDGTDLADVDAFAAQIAEPTSACRGDDARQFGILAARYAPVDWETAWKEQPETVEWLIEPFVEAGTVNVLYGRRGIGKSLIALDWALRLAREGRTVVYVDRENRPQDAVERLKAFGTAMTELPHLQRHLPYYSFPALPPLGSEAGGRHLLALAEANNASLVIVDTTMRFLDGEENVSDTFAAFYRCSVVPLKSRGIAVLRLDHPGKDGTLRGSSGKEDDSDTVWKLTETAQGRKYKLHREKNRTGHAPDFEDVDVDRRYEPLRHVWAVPDRSRENEAVGQLCGQLDRLGVPSETGRDRCRTALNNAGIKASNDLLSKAIRQRQKDADSLRTAGQSVSAPSAVRATPVSERDGVADSPAHPPADRRTTCARCGEPMTVIEPGQQYHPMCEEESAS